MGRSMFPFGSGKMFFKRSTDLGFFRVGVAAMQEGGWSIDTDVKELHGSNRFPVDVRTGMGKIEGTAKYTDWDANVIGTILSSTVTTGANALLINVDATVPSSSTYTVTVTVPGSGPTFVKNLEVVYGSTHATPGVPLTQVAPASEATGSYSVAAAGTTTKVYTFAAGDASAAIRISYMYNITTTGKTITWNNVAIGTQPILAGVFQGISDAKQMVLELDYVVAHGMKWSQRIDDWSHLDNQLKAFANPATDVIGRINLLTD